MLRKWSEQFTKEEKIPEHQVKGQNSAFIHSDIAQHNRDFLEL